ncbi:MAG TPA: 6-bladed beta-propeller [Longimicrobiales bacterium]|nr:6-bladed beta-propeller [Longimicrobiales bacterium]
MDVLKRGGDVERYGVGTGWWVLAGLVLAGPAAAQQTVDLPAQDKNLPVAFDDVFRVGSMDGADWETFGEIGGVAFDRQGRLYVFDRQSSRVVVTDASGNFVREVGKAGEGPGELRQPMGFAVLRDGSIVISDMAHRAYVVYGPDGTYQRMVSFGGDGSMIVLGDLSADPRGDAVFMGGGRMSISMSRSGPAEPPAPPTNRPIKRIGLSGTDAAEEVLVEAWQPPRPQGPQTLSGGGMRFSVAMAGPRTFEPGLYVGPLPDGGVAYVDSAAYAVKVVDGNGTLQRVLRRPFTPRPVTPALQEAEKQRRLDELEAGEGPQMRIVTSSGSGAPRALNPEAVKEMMKGQLEQMQFYPELPVVMNLATGWTGKIWVVRRGQQPTEPGPIDVLTPAGQYVGTFAVGSTALPSAFGPDGLVAFIERDEFDVPTVVVKRLPAVLR